MTVGILLAAGAAARFGSQKLLAPLHGRPLVLHALGVLRPAVAQVIAVVRWGDDELTDVLTQAGAYVVVCDQAAYGMGYSLACGSQLAPKDANLLIALGDMPAIAPSTVHRIVDALDAGSAIAIPCYDGRRGHPVGFAARFGPVLRKLTQDQGARSVLAEHPEAVQELAVQDPGVLADVDTPSDLARLSGTRKD